MILLEIIGGLVIASFVGLGVYTFLRLRERERSRARYWTDLLTRPAPEDTDVHKGE